jgi:hypothetical protein
MPLRRSQSLVCTLTCAASAFAAIGGCTTTRPKNELSPEFQEAWTDLEREFAENRPSSDEASIAEPTQEASREP